MYIHVCVLYNSTYQAMSFSKKGHVKVTAMSIFKSHDQP